MGPRGSEHANMNYLRAKKEEKGENAFEAQAFFVRTKGAGNVETWPEALTVRGESTSQAKVNLNGSEVDVDELKLYLRRDKPCCYVCTETWVIRDRVVLELCDREDVWLQCILTPPSANQPSWKLECKIEEESETGSTGPRWPIDVEVSLVGKFKNTPCFLSKNAKSTRKISRTPKVPSLQAINEDQYDQAFQANSVDGKKALFPDFSEQFEETYRALGGVGNLSDGETGDLTWFNAGLRIGVGVGLGICLGAGLGAGILVRSYQVTANSLKRRLSSL